MPNPQGAPVLFSINNNVARITLNLPKIHNAFDDTVIASLIETLDLVADNQNLRACVLDANGKHFSAGANLNWMKRMANMSIEENRNDARQLASLMQRLDDLPVPTIAAVQGAAFGGAIGLISCCDIAIASERAKFCLSEVKLGLSPATISPYVLAAMGERRCRRLFLTAEVFKAEQALQWGLVHETVEHHALDETVDRMLDSILATGPSASRATKKLIKVVQSPDTNVFDYTSDLIAKLRVGDEGQHGLSSFFEGSTPKWVQENK